MPESTPAGLLYTEDVKLAACLVVLGVQPSSSRPTMPFVNPQGQRRTRFHFESTPEAVEYVKVWCNRDLWKQFETDHPEHPLVYMRAAFTMRERYLDAALSSAVLVVTPNARLGGFELKVKQPEKRTP